MYVTRYVFVVLRAEEKTGMNFTLEFRVTRHKLCRATLNQKLSLSFNFLTSPWFHGEYIWGRHIQSRILIFFRSRRPNFAEGDSLAVTLLNSRVLRISLSQ